MTPLRETSELLFSLGQELVEASIPESMVNVFRRGRIMALQKPDGAAGFHTTAENSKRAHFRALALQTPPEFHEGGKNENCGGRVKKARSFGPPPFRAPPFVVTNSTSKKWSKSKLAEVEIGRSRSGRIRKKVGHSRVCPSHHLHGRNRCFRSGVTGRFDGRIEGSGGRRCCTSFRDVILWFTQHVSVGRG